MKEKLKSTSGASILVALLFFLMCAMAGAVIITAASASSGRIANLKSRDQDYYTLSSAARLLRDEIENQTISIYSDDGDEFEDYYSEPSGELTELLKTSTKAIFENTLKESPETITYDDSLTLDGIQDINKVNVDFTMKSDYSISISLSLDGSDTKYIVDIPAAISQNKEKDDIVVAEKKVTRIVTTLTWTDATITIGQLES